MNFYKSCSVPIMDHVPDREPIVEILNRVSRKYKLYREKDIIDKTLYMSQLNSFKHLLKRYQRAGFDDISISLFHIISLSYSVLINEFTFSSIEEIEETLIGYHYSSIIYIGAEQKDSYFYDEFYDRVCELEEFFNRGYPEVENDILELISFCCSYFIE